jgi:hypothetical protein
MVAFASPSDFYYYHLERGETWDYNEMRQEVGDLCAYGNLYFSIDDLVGAGAVLGSAESPDRFPPASNSYPFPYCWVWRRARPLSAPTCTVAGSHTATFAHNILYLGDFGAASFYPLQASGNV